VLNNKNWGADKNCRRKTYFAFVRSKLDYSSKAHDNSDSRLQLSETINNNAARLVLGTSRSSTIPGIKLYLYMFEDENYYLLMLPE
ncbi:hypothetical protein HHI36_007966, partial [Cryptolaemus montrouzieri]